MALVADQRSTRWLAAHLRDQFLSVFGTLMQSQSLEPEPKVNQLFTDLVRVCGSRIGQDAERVLRAIRESER